MKPSYGLTDDEIERMLEESIDHAEDDVTARLLIEARIEADSILRATRQALARAGPTNGPPSSRSSAKLEEAMRFYRSQSHSRRGRRAQPGLDPLWRSG